MGFWLAFWTVVLVVAVVALTLLAVVVSLGGFFDIRAMFRRIDQQHGQADRGMPGEP